MPLLHIAVVDDEPDITRLLAGYLTSQGFRVTELASGAALTALLPNDPPELVLLDLGLPGEDGFAIARQVREHWRCGLIIVSGRGDAVDKVVGLEVGADDYVTKPFDLRELLARIKAVARRLQPVAGAMPSPIANLAPMALAAVTASVSASAAEGTSTGDAKRPCWRFDTWQLDSAARRLVGAGDVEVALTSGEFDLLCVFVQRAGRVLSRDTLLAATRGFEAGPFDRSIDVQVGRLRKKLEADPGDPQLIKTVRGAGYILVSPVTTR